MIRDIDELRRALESERKPGTVFVFDLGNVMLPYDNRRHAVRLLDYGGESARQIEELIHTSDYHRLFDTGSLDPETFRVAVCAELGLMIEREPFWRMFRERFHPVNRQMIDLVTDCGLASHQTAVLSNIDPVALAHLQTLGPLLDLFDIKCFSCERAARKPEPRAFQNVVDEAPPGARFVFVDDLERNVLAARAFGWQAIHFALPEAPNTGPDHDR